MLDRIMWTSVKGIGFLFVGLMVLAVFSSIGDALKSPERRTDEPAAAAAEGGEAELDKIKMGACLAAVDAVMHTLTEPSSASIPACGWNYGKFYVNISQDHQTAIVQGQMGSTNSSGGRLRGHWKVKLKNNGTRGWAAVRVKIDG